MAVKTETVKRKARPVVPVAIAALFAIYGGLQTLPHLHVQGSGFSFNSAPSSSPLHRCLQCAIAHGPALTPESISCPQVPAQTYPLLGETSTLAAAAFLLPGKPRAPPA